MTREQKMHLLGDSYAILHHSYSGNFAVLTDELTDGTLYVLTGWLEKSNIWVTLATSDDFGFIMEKYLELVDSELEKILHPERKIAESLYNAACDMDCHDYDETAEKEIKQLELALSNIKGYSNAEMQTLYNCLSAIYGD